MTTKKQESIKDVYEVEEIDVTPIATAVYSPYGGVWRYKPTDEDHPVGETNKRTLRMRVPQGPAPEDYLVRLHEMEHAKRSIVRRPADCSQAYMFIEEGRINAITEEDFPEQKPLIREFEDNAVMNTETSPYAQDRDRALMSLAVRGRHLPKFEDPDLTKRFAKFAREVAKYQNTWRNRDTRPIASFARDFDALFPVPPPPEGGGKGKGKGDNPECPTLPETSDGAPEASKGSPKGSKFDGLSDIWGDALSAGKGGDPEWRSKNPDSRWAPMTIQRPPLVRPSNQAKVGRVRTWRRMDEGSVLIAPWRTLTDGFVFRSRLKAKGKGGSLLLDASGSMGLTYKMIEKFLEAAPLADIAMYWGTGGKGYLRILAGKGKMATKEQFQKEGGYNEVDGPAMDWLISRPEPRIWVSDGGITGMGDGALTIRDSEEFIRKIRDNHVVQIQRLPDAAIWFQKVLLNPSTPPPDDQRFIVS